DADDRVASRPALEVSPKRFGIADVSPHEFLIDDDLRRRGDIVKAREVGSREERNAHRLEIIRRDRVAQRPVWRRFPPGASFENERPQRETVNVERYRYGDGRRLHGRESPKALEQPASEFS